MAGRVEQQYSIGQRIAPAKIVNQPAVGRPALADRRLNRRNTLMKLCMHHRRGIIFAETGSRQISWMPEANPVLQYAPYGPRYATGDRTLSHHTVLLT